MKNREDVQTLPVEINVKAARLFQEEQIFYTTDEDEAEEQYWAWKEAIRRSPATTESAKTIQSRFYKFDKLATWDTSLNTEKLTDHYRAI